MNVMSCNVSVQCCKRNIVCILGLKLRLKGETTILKCFPYALFPTMPESVPVDWQNFSTKKEETDSILLHELAEEDQLADILDEFKQGYTKAAVLINMTDSYELEEKFVSSIKEVPFTTVTVQKTDGAEIMKLYLTCNEDLQASVMAENGVDEPELPAKTREFVVLEKQVTIQGHEQPVGAYESIIQGGIPQTGKPL